MNALVETIKLNSKSLSLLGEGLETGKLGDEEVANWLREVAAVLTSVAKKLDDIQEMGPLPPE